MGRILMALKRLDHWELQLQEYIDSKKGVAFSYDPATGTDCATFTADAILAMTGIDIAADFRGKYTTQTGALKAIKEVTRGSTVEDVAHWVADKFDIALLDNILFAQRGDLVLFEGAKGPALGIVYLDGRNAVFVGDKGLSKLPVRKVKTAWRIGG
jgi:cell wall-associated NlpC family hydrolase